jgi:tetratricopeptide (TPR) repeat protein
MAAISNFAFLMLLQDRPYEAAPFVGRAVTIAPEDYRSLILLGELRFQSGEHEGARECFVKVLDQDPDNVEALARLSVLAHHQRHPTVCQEFLRRAEDSVQGETGSWRGLCYAYSKTGRIREFLDCLVRWSKADPGAAAPWVELAAEYDRQGLEYSRNAWRVVFELRGYVKISCKECGSNPKKGYDKVEGFDIYTDVVCPKCGALIKMPAGLSKV